MLFNYAALFNYAPILDVCEPFLIAHRAVRTILDTSPGGVPIPAANIIDPQHQRHAALYKLLRRLDRLTFGPFGMQMPSWVFYDCAVMPGALFGHAMRAEHLEPWALAALQVPAGYDGLVPVSQVIAIPTLAGFRDERAVPDTWLMYSAESINQVSPGLAPAGLLKLTLALGLRVFPVKTLVGTTQWRSQKLSSYVDLGPFELITAYTPAHSLPRTLSFQIDIEEVNLLTLLASPSSHPSAPPPNSLLDPDDVGALRALQQEIEAGWRVRVVDRPAYYGSQVRVALHKTPPATAADGSSR